MLIMNRTIICGFMLFLFLKSSGQEKKPYTDNYIYGDWKCVRLDTHGFQKFSWEKAQKLPSSILTVEKTTYYYNNVDFIEVCHFACWNKYMYDTVHLEGRTLDVLYKKRELSKVVVLEPTDSTGDFGCYNDCAIFYLKGDTLINVCGGYTLFFTKIKLLPAAKDYSFSSRGDFERDIECGKEVKSLTIEYVTYNEPDNIIITDGVGKVLYESGMTTGDKLKTVKIPLSATIHSVHLKISSSVKGSQWKVKLKFD